MLQKYILRPNNPTGEHDTVSINNRKGIVNEISIAIMAKKMKTEKNEIARTATASELLLQKRIELEIHT
jgi:hypothetical protein